MIKEMHKERIPEHGDPEKADEQIDLNTIFSPDSKYMKEFSFGDGGRI